MTPTQKILFRFWCFSKKSVFLAHYSITWNSFWQHWTFSLNAIAEMWSTQRTEAGIIHWRRGSKIINQFKGPGRGVYKAHCYPYKQHFSKYGRSGEERDPFADFVPDTEFSREVPSFIECASTSPPLHPTTFRPQPPLLPPQLLEIILVCHSLKFWRQWHQDCVSPELGQRCIKF